MIATLPTAASAQPPGAVEHLQGHGRPPAEYVLAKVRDHRAVLLGEAHWVRHDAQLLIELVPRLREAGVDSLAVEVLPASTQDSLDRIVTADAWDRAAALAVLRQAAWPYAEYLDILRAVWEHNRGKPPGQRLRLVAMGPGDDWRERLPQGVSYEAFMAGIVLDLLREPGSRVLSYAGLHHAFTRYHQPELPREGERVERFFERTGNILWRELGEEVFSISLSSPWRCRDREGKGWTYCPPLDGAVDCAAAAVGHPLGFDVAGSPFAELRIPPSYYYGRGYPDLRFVDFVDGFVWHRPVEEYRGVTLIPLAELAPDPASLAEVLAHNPFSDEEGLGRDDLERLWQDEAKRLLDPQRLADRPALTAWRETCVAPPDGASD